MPTEVVSAQGIHPSALVYTRRTTDDGKVVPSRLEVEVDVSDQMVKNAVWSADNFERAVVGIPYRRGGSSEPAWKEVPLAYQGVEILGYYAREKVDSHEAV